MFPDTKATKNISRCYGSIGQDHRYPPYSRALKWAAWPRQHVARCPVRLSLELRRSMANIGGRYGSHDKLRKGGVGRNPLGIRSHPGAFDSNAHAQSGVASYYKSGSLTANGERFDPQGLTAAHRSLSFDTRVRVTSVDTGRSVVVRINDRGPFASGRIIDLSFAAARVIGLHTSGVANVSMEVLR